MHGRMSTVDADSDDGTRRPYVGSPADMHRHNSRLARLAHMGSIGRYHARTHAVWGGGR
jgi:hypothetical protein